MPIPTVYTPIQPTPSIVMKPVVWVPNVWTAVICSPGPPIIPEVFTVTVTNFKPVITPAPYFGDPGLTVSLIRTWRHWRCNSDLYISWNHHYDRYRDLYGLSVPQQRI